MAVELAKLSLWLHSFTVGAPLSFLDHHLRWGNSLIGADVRTVEAAIQPDGQRPVRPLRRPLRRAAGPDQRHDPDRRAGRHARWPTCGRAPRTSPRFQAS